MIRQNKPQKRQLKKPLVIICAIALLAGGVFVGLELTGVTSFIHKKRPIPHTATQNTKGETLPQPSAATGSATNKQDGANDNTWSSGEKTPSNDMSATDSVKLEAPTGNFVSNHHPNLSGKPAPNVIQSSCVTSPNTTCQIIFTKGTITKSLTAQKTDVGGGTYWTWRLQDIGLTTGSWKVQAKAQLGAQTQTADDATTLEVQE